MSRMHVDDGFVSNPLRYPLPLVRSKESIFLGLTRHHPAYPGTRFCVSLLLNKERFEELSQAIRQAKTVRRGEAAPARVWNVTRGKDGQLHRR